MSKSNDNDNTTCVLPDGSAFSTFTLPLPKDHWLYQPVPDEPPAPFRVGVGKEITIQGSRKEISDKVREAARYALQASTNSGQWDEDPDAVIQNLLVGLFGWHTTDGTKSGDLVPKR